MRPILVLAGWIRPANAPAASPPAQTPASTRKLGKAESHERG